MSLRVSRNLVGFLQEEVGENLRSVIHYEERSFEIMYLRSDVAAEYTVEEVERVVEELRLESWDTTRQEGMYIHGRLGCTLRFFAEAVELHFPHREFSGTAIALDPHTDAVFYTFINECLNQIPDEYQRF